MLWKDIKEKDFFFVNPEESIDRLLKEGIYRVFLGFAKMCTTMEGKSEVKRSICCALDLLIRLNVPTTPMRLRIEGGPKPGYSFISRANKALMQFCPKVTAQDELEMLRHDMTSLTNKQSKQLATRSAKQRANRKAGDMAERILIANVSNDVEKLVAKGVLRVLAEAESFAGPFTKTFPQRKPFLRKLKTIYQRATVGDLVADRGLYSCALATDGDLVMRGVLQEEDDFRFEG